MNNEATEKYLETAKKNVLAKTGKTVEHWAGVVKASGIEKVGQQVAMLKEKHGITHGYAQMICQIASGRLDASPDELLEMQFRGKESLRPLHDAIAAYARKLGKDVGVDPGKTATSLRRSKKFAAIVPASKTRIDLGINLKGMPGTDRLAEEKPGAMCTHKVKLESAADFDAEVKAWLKEAYGRA